jgi:HAD superfamily phosphatase (TIGR01681 family)
MKKHTTDIDHISIPDNCRLVIFDLDDTLHTKKIMIESHIVDILQVLKNNGIKIALASLNNMAGMYLYFYNIGYFFDHIEQGKFSDEYVNEEEKKLYKSGSKSHMYKRILDKLKIKSEDVLVFDDNWFHCLEARYLNMKYITIRTNYTLQWSDFKRGIELFDKKPRRRNSCCL